MKLSSEAKVEGKKRGESRGEDKVLLRLYLLAKPMKFERGQVQASHSLSH